MPHRIVIACPNCKDLKGNGIEITEVTVWIDEDKKLYFIANCDRCEQTQTIETSAEQLANKFIPCQPDHATPLLYVM